MKVKLKESPEINLIWTDGEVRLLLESVRNFKTQKISGSTTLFDPSTSCFFLKHVSLFLRQMQNYFFVFLKLQTSLACNHSTIPICNWTAKSAK